jgi:pimeloyl-ACP methyl ester carboxylesterase
MDTFVTDLAEICDRAKLDRPVVIGHSLGGMLALELAARIRYVTWIVLPVDAGAMIK